MAKNRVIYQSEALYVSDSSASTGASAHEQLERVQSANYSFNITRQDVNQFGQLGKIGSLVLEAPTVSFDTSYLLTDGFNETSLGFYVQTGALASGSFISGHLADGSGQNLYVLTSPEGVDMNRDSIDGTIDVIGIGNAYLSDYTLDLSIGSLPSVSVSFEAANINVSSGDAINLPAINQANGNLVGGTINLPAPTTGYSAEVALRPGDVSLNIASIDGQVLTDIDNNDTDSFHVQSASLSIPLSRTSLERLGTKFAYARAVDFPVQATLSINAIVNEITTGSLSNFINDDSTKTLTLTVNKPGTSNAAVIYTMKGAQIQSESFSSSIGSNKSVDLTFVTSVGGPSDTDNGVFCSGTFTEEPFA